MTKSLTSTGSEVIAPFGPTHCPWCGSGLRIDPTKIGRYVCLSARCGESFIEDPADPLTWADAINSEGR